MSEASRVQELVSPLRERAVELEAKRFRVDREKIVGRMLQTTPASKGFGFQRRVLLRSAGLFVAAAAIGLVAWKVSPRRNVSTLIERPEMGKQFSVTAQRGSVTHARDGARDVLLPGQPNRASAEGELETGAEARALLRTGDGIEIEVFENSRVSLTELKADSSPSVLRLDAGSVRCRVPALPNGHTFVVVTNDARVIDRGNIFSVETSDHTVVRVERGEVLVRYAEGETLVTQAASFQTKPTILPEAFTLETQVENPRSGIPTGRTSRTRTLQRSQRGTLAEETKLLRSALAAERNGRPRDATLALKTLLARYPDSPLTPDARVALARVDSR